MERSACGSQQVDDGKFRQQIFACYLNADQHYRTLMIFDGVAEAVIPKVSVYSLL